jgi:hypothetical protein
MGFPGNIGLEFVPGGAINVLGALLVAAVGVGVLLVRPRTRRCTAFGVHLAAFGGAFALHNFGSRNVPWINTVLGSTTALLLVIGGLAMFRVAWLTRASEHGGPLLKAVIVVVVAGLVTPMTVWLLLNPAAANRELPSIVDAWPSDVFYLAIAAYSFFVAGVWTAAAVLTVRAARPGITAHEFSQLAILTSALMLFSSFLAGAYLLVDHPYFLRAGVASTTMTVLVGGAWLVHAARTPHAAKARMAAFVILGIAVVGMIFTALGLTGLGGPVRMAAAVLIAWGILRYQVLDFDVKLRWGLERSTVASIFIAVFFLVSEGAQEFFGAAASNEWIGIVAAAALMFFIAPLQRLAERVGARALPDARPAASLLDDEVRDLYEQRLRSAWSDGALTRDERVLLEHLRERLRIPVEEAAALERHVLAQASAGGATSPDPHLSGSSFTG